MKYTVVIRQPVPDHLHTQLVQELSVQFELNSEQAARLASRRSGRLMKPTSRKRAEQLLGVFQSVGAQVALEEVRDDTTLMRDPFAGERPGLVGPATLPIMPATPYSSGPLMGADGSLPAARFSLSSLHAANTDAANTDEATLAPARWGYEAQNRQAPEGAVWAAPGSSTGSPEAATARQNAHLDALFPVDALEVPPAFVQHDAALITPQYVQSSVPEMNLGDLPLGAAAGERHSGRPRPGRSTGDDAALVATPSSAAVLSRPGSAQPAASEPISDDAWADFTGSLNSDSQTLAAAGANDLGSNVTSIMNMDAEPDPVRALRRSSLSRRVLVSTLLPLGLFTLVTLGFLIYALPRAQNQLITDNAKAVAVAVGSNLDVTDQDTVYAQLDALIKRSSVGFVQVNLPDGTTFFRSKNAYTDGPLSEQIAAWVQQHPENSTFVQSGSAADSYRYQLSLLEQVGAGNSDQAKSLRQSVADPANQAFSRTTYLLSSINVTRNAQAERVVSEGVRATTGTPLYSIVVGVPGDAAFALLRNTLLLVLGVALLAFVVAALLAVRTARQVVRPIERLVLAADAISMGDLDRPVSVERNDEIGDLAQALERMRLSLEAAMERLRKRRKAA